MLCCIKMAKYYELTEDDVVGYRRYRLRRHVHQPHRRAQRATRRIRHAHAAARDYSEHHATACSTDSMLELSYQDRKRIHNLKYYTWVEQQGKTYEEINQQWYDTHYWTDMHAQADELDKLINEFNDATGVLANM